eukprot:jgi/Mesvir1/24892/Mv22115-RA.1
MVSEDEGRVALWRIRDAATGMPGEPGERGEQGEQAWQGGSDVRRPKDGQLEEVARDAENRNQRDACAGMGRGDRGRDREDVWASQLGVARLLRALAATAAGCELLLAPVGLEGSSADLREQSSCVTDGGDVPGSELDCGSMLGGQSLAEAALDGCSLTDGRSLPPGGSTSALELLCLLLVRLLAPAAALKQLKSGSSVCTGAKCHVAPICTQGCPAYGTDHVHGTCWHCVSGAGGAAAGSCRGEEGRDGTPPGSSLERDTALPSSSALGACAVRAEEREGDGCKCSHEEGDVRQEQRQQEHVLDDALPEANVVDDAMPGGAVPEDVVKAYLDILCEFAHVAGGQLCVHLSLSHAIMPPMSSTLDPPSCPVTFPWLASSTSRPPASQLPRKNTLGQPSLLHRTIEAIGQAVLRGAWPGLVPALLDALLALATFPMGLSALLHVSSQPACFRHGHSCVVERGPEGSTLAWTRMDDPRLALTGLPSMECADTSPLLAACVRHLASCYSTSNSGSPAWRRLLRTMATWSLSVRATRAMFGQAGGRGPSSTPTASVASLHPTPTAPGRMFEQAGGSSFQPRSAVPGASIFQPTPAKEGPCSVADSPQGCSHSPPAVAPGRRAGCARCQQPMVANCGTEPARAQGGSQGLLQVLLGDVRSLLAGELRHLGSGEAAEECHAAATPLNQPPSVTGGTSQGQLPASLIRGQQAAAAAAAAAEPPLAPGCAGPANTEASISATALPTAWSTGHQAYATDPLAATAPASSSPPLPSPQPSPPRSVPQPAPPTPSHQPSPPLPPPCYEEAVLFALHAVSEPPAPLLAPLQALSACLGTWHGLCAALHISGLVTRQGGGHPSALPRPLCLRDLLRSVLRGAPAVPGGLTRDTQDLILLRLLAHASQGLEAGLLLDAALGMCRRLRRRCVAVPRSGRHRGGANDPHNPVSHCVGVPGGEAVSSAEYPAAPGHRLPGPRWEDPAATGAGPVDGSIVGGLSGAEEGRGPDLSTGPAAKDGVTGMNMNDAGRSDLHNGALPLHEDCMHGKAHVNGSRGILGAGGPDAEGEDAPPLIVDERSLMAAHIIWAARGPLGGAAERERIPSLSSLGLFGSGTGGHAGGGGGHAGGAHGGGGQGDDMPSPRRLRMAIDRASPSRPIACDSCTWGQESSQGMVGSSTSARTGHGMAPADTGDGMAVDATGGDTAAVFAVIHAALEAGKYPSWATVRALLSSLSPSHTQGSRDASGAATAAASEPLDKPRAEQSPPNPRAAATFAEQPTPSEFGGSGKPPASSSSAADASIEGQLAPPTGLEPPSESPPSTPLATVPASLGDPRDARTATTMPTHQATPEGAPWSASMGANASFFAALDPHALLSVEMRAVMLESATQLFVEHALSPHVRVLAPPGHPVALIPADASSLSPQEPSLRAIAGGAMVVNPTVNCQLPVDASRKDAAAGAAGSFQQGDRPGVETRSGPVAMAMDQVNCKAGCQVECQAECQVDHQVGCKSSSRPLVSLLSSSLHAVLTMPSFATATDVGYADGAVVANGYSAGCTAAGGGGRKGSFTLADDELLEGQPHEDHLLDNQPRAGAVHAVQNNGSGTVSLLPVGGCSLDVFAAVAWLILDCHPQKTRGFLDSVAARREGTLVGPPLSEHARGGKTEGAGYRGLRVYDTTGSPTRQASMDHLACCESAVTQVPAGTAGDVKGGTLQSCREGEGDGNRLLLITCQLVEYLAELELPAVVGALRAAGASLAQAAALWLGALWLRRLAWADVLTYMAVVMGGGADYQVYFLVAVLCHLQPAICRLALLRGGVDLHSWLAECDLAGFQVPEYYPSMRALERKYRPIVLRAMSMHAQ